MPDRLDADRAVQARRDAAPSLGTGRARPRVAVGRTAATATLIGAAVAAITLAGCTSARVTAAPIELASAFVIQENGLDAVDAYLVIQNSGPADQLVTVRSSSGGTVTLRGPGNPGVTAARTVTSLSIPGHSMTRLDPAGIHLVITRPGPMRQGTDITLTLVFAHAGTMQVAAQVTNPQTSGSDGYFGP